MKESKIEKHLKKITEQHGGECLKWVSPGRNGVNDRIVFLPGGRMYLMECKRPGYSLDPHQRRFRGRMAELGFTVHKCDSIQWVDDFFNDIRLPIPEEAEDQARRKKWIGTGHPPRP